MEETIELKELFLIIKKRMLLIAILGFTALVLSGVLSFFVLTPRYQTTTDLIVNSITDPNQITNADIQTSLNLMNTYQVILRSPIILDQVSERLGLNISGSQLQGLITVSNQNNSQVLSVSVKHEDPSKARDIANEVAEVFRNEIGDIMNVENVSILARAELPTSPVEPRPTLNMAIGFLLGLMVGVGATFILEYLDTKVKTEQDIEQLLELPVLGVIPNMTEEDFKKRT